MSHRHVSILLAVSFAYLLLLMLMVISTASCGVAAQSTTTAAADVNNSVIPTKNPTVDYEDARTQSKIDLIFSFFAEDRDSINSYTVTIAQMLKVPLRRIDFYNIQLGVALPPIGQRRLSNTPYGAKTMVRLTVQPALATETTADTSPVVRDRLMVAAKVQDPALVAIFIDDAYPIDISDAQIFQYTSSTVFDLMYTFVIATMGLAYVAFIVFVISKIIKDHQYSKIEKANREREKEQRKMRAKAKSRASGGGEGDDIDDDESDAAIDATKWDEASDLPGDAGDDDIRDEDGLAVRTLVEDVTSMLKGGPERSVSFGSKKAPLTKNQALLQELDRLALPPSNKRHTDDEDL